MWYVIETAMYPCAFKVEHRLWANRNNSFTEFFKTFEEAQTEVNKRNLRDRSAVKILGDYPQE